ncbi:hypothetical protein [Actinophytocola sediminis]
MGARGSRLWAEWSGHRWAPGHLITLEEACRAADLLERLHLLLAQDGTAWLELARNDAESDEDTTELRVVVNGLMVEIRQQQANFRQLVAELRLSGRSGSTTNQPAVPTAGAEPAGVEPGDGSAVTAPAADEGGLGDLIDAADRFSPASEG